VFCCLLVYRSSEASACEDGNGDTATVKRKHSPGPKTATSTTTTKVSKTVVASGSYVRRRGSQDALEPGVDLTEEWMVALPLLAPTDSGLEKRWVGLSRVVREVR
jgi:hypothetical protein